MSHRHAMVLVVFASVLTLVAGVARANLFNMPGAQTSLSFVTVGDPGNAPDTAVMGNEDGTTGYGSVLYVYRMGEYDVTIGQYVQFLNAVAQTDTYGLYNSYMDDYSTLGIAQSGTSGSYNYSVTGGDPQAANCPVHDVTWGDAARFCNWLQNGQPTYPAGTPGEVAGSTETGAYTLNGDTTNYMETRSSGATFFIPSENEWYKAAYYKGGSTNAGYWAYPTQSNTAPSNVLSSSGSNNANYNTGSFGNFIFTDPTNNLTPVGAFSASPGPYGTYDMGGDVWQCNEAIIGSSRGLRGGSWYDRSSILASSYRSHANTPTYPYSDVGFRVASLEPGDANGDHQVDINDLTIVLANYNQTGMTWSQGEFTGDGTVDINDLTIVLANYDYGVTAAGLAAVPEPSALVLIGLGIISLVGCTYRRRR